MPTGEEILGVDLYRSVAGWLLQLPTVASRYTEAEQSVDGTASDLSHAFFRPPRLGGAFGPAYEPWKALRDEMRRILAKTASNLELTGEALRLAAEEYSRSNDRSRAGVQPAQKWRVGVPAFEIRQEMIDPPRGG